EAAGSRDARGAERPLRRHPARARDAGARTGAGRGRGAAGPAEAGAALQPLRVLPAAELDRPGERAGLTRARYRLLRLLPLLGGLARGADPRAQQGDALGITPERPGHQLTGAAARAHLGRLTRLHLVREPRDFRFHGGLHARDYTRATAARALSSADVRPLPDPPRRQPGLRHRLRGEPDRSRRRRTGDARTGPRADRRGAAAGLGGRTLGGWPSRD